jgi:hypothetical protein
LGGIDILTDIGRLSFVAFVPDEGKFPLACHPRLDAGDANIRSRQIGGAKARESATIILTLLPGCHKNDPCF